ncbi:hypothetical protein [Chryseobacterium sp.]|uniref:hypothetical protein n=1 Tax=Chryseobacterium sp. TaxID=1871047 RepID=UPI0023F57976|nr:hypothetical protein [Chryseobacterium sp.]
MGEPLRKYFYDDKHISAEIIKTRLGWWYHQYSDNKELGKIQDITKAEGLALRNDNNSISPYDWR